MKVIYFIVIIVFSGCSRDWGNPLNQNTIDNKIPSNGLIAYYPFNGNANDESGNGNNGNVNGAILSEDRFGKANNAFSFDGNDDYVDIGNNVKPSFPTTISVWVKVDDMKTECILRNDSHDSGSYRYGITLFIHQNGNVSGNYYEGYSNSSNRINKVSNDIIVKDMSWHHFLVVFNGHKNVNLCWDGSYIDGSYQGSGSGIAYSNGSGRIGHYKTNTIAPANQYFGGKIDDIRVYNRALTEDEISALYHEGGWMN